MSPQMNMQISHASSQSITPAQRSTRSTLL